MQTLAPNSDPHPTGRTYAGTSMQQRQATRRQQFMQAGHVLFGTVGFRATTVRMLCKQAALTDRYFYESFDSIESLLAAVYQQRIEQIQAQVLQAVLAVLPEQPVEQVIASGLEAFFAAVECPQTARIVWLEVLGVSPRIDQLYLAAIENFTQMFSQFGRSVFPSLSLNEQELKILATGTIGAVSQATMAWLLSDYQASRATMVKSLTPLLLGLVYYAQHQATLEQQ